MNANIMEKKIVMTTTEAKAAGKIGIISCGWDPPKARPPPNGGGRRSRGRG